MRTWLLNAGVAMLIIAVPTTASASTILPLDLPTLTKRAERVVIGTAMAEESFWDGQRIYTRYRVRIDDLWVGELPENKHVNVVRLGGVVGEIGQHVEGAGVLALHKPMVLFLASHRGDDWRLVGMQQGVFSLPEGVDWQAPPTSELHGVGQIGPGPDIPNTLLQFRDLVRAYHHAP